jgi:hypothetical protein
MEPWFAALTPHRSGSLRRGTWLSPEVGSWAWAVRPANHSVPSQNLAHRSTMELVDVG